jgi:hypothetical protein
MKNHDENRKGLCTRRRNRVCRELEAPEAQEALEIAGVAHRIGGEIRNRIAKGFRLRKPLPPEVGVPGYSCLKCLWVAYDTYSVTALWRSGDKAFGQR